MPPFWTGFLVSERPACHNKNCFIVCTGKLDALLPNNPSMINHLCHHLTRAGPCLEDLPFGKSGSIQRTCAFCLYLQKVWLCCVNQSKESRDDNIERMDCKRNARRFSSIIWLILRDILVFGVRTNNDNCRNFPTEKHIPSRPKIIFRLKLQRIESVGNFRHLFLQNCIFVPPQAKEIYSLASIF